MSTINKKITTLSILYLFVVSLGYAQHDAKALEVLNKCKNYYENKNDYSFDTEYNLYRKSKAKKEGHYSGFIAKNATKFYMKIDATETLSQNNQTLKVSHSEKAMSFHQYPLQMNVDQNPLAIDKYKAYFKTIKLKEEGNYFVCEFTTHDITQIPFRSVAVYIDKNTYQLKKQVLIYNKKAPFAKSDGGLEYEEPRLEIVLKNFRDESNMLSTKNLTDYIRITGTTVSKSSKYNAYELITE